MLLISIIYAILLVRVVSKAEKNLIICLFFLFFINRFDIAEFNILKVIILAEKLYFLINNFFNNINIETDIFYNILL